jgi:CubicO group peptidase (beta-lactamase class C family)
MPDVTDELFAEWDSPTSPGCALAIVRGGEVVCKRAYGTADLERCVPLSPRSVFDLASTGKQFTAFIVALMEAEGALSLDDRVRQYLPALPAYADPIAIRHLVYHTSGLRDYTALMSEAGMQPRNHYREEELLGLIVRQDGLDFLPGSEHRYSNSGYFLLGMVAERISRKSLHALIRERILQPLGMRSTDFSDDPRRIVRNRALGYTPLAGGGYYTDVASCGGFGDGPVISSVEDLLLWDRNFYNNRLGGGPDAIRRMITPGALDNGQPLTYAFGLRIGMHRGLSTVSHAGSWAGYGAELLRFPEQELSVVCLANLRSFPAARLAMEVADTCLATGESLKRGQPVGSRAGHLKGQESGAVSRTLRAGIRSHEVLRRG